MVRSIDSPFDSYSLTGLIIFLYFAFFCSLHCEISQIRTSGWIMTHSLYNLHMDGVEHHDKTLLLRGIGRPKVLHSIQETMLIASLALKLDLDCKFLQYTGFNVHSKGQ